MEWFSDLILFSITNDQSWKDSWRKHWELTPGWIMWNVFILWNSNKYVVTCSREDTNFLSFYDIVTVKAKKFNIFAKLVVTGCFNYVFLCSLTLLIWSAGLSCLRFCDKINLQIFANLKMFLVHESSSSILK